MPNVQLKTPDDGQRNCPKHVEFLDKNKFWKLVRLLVLLKESYQFILNWFIHLSHRAPWLSANYCGFGLLSRPVAGLTLMRGIRSCTYVCMYDADSLCDIRHIVTALSATATAAACISLNISEPSLILSK